MSPELAGLSAARCEPSSSAPGEDRDPETVDISVVMPCLNEAGSVGICVHKAWEGIRAAGLTGEVIVVDNGSDDHSTAVAEAAGARVVHQTRRGYGNAYLKGFDVARGRIIIMGDSDDSYDFTKIPDLIKPIEEGYEYVLGSRFAGYIFPNAMPWSHRRIGNPILTAILNALFGLKVSDAHSGFRAITRVALDKIVLQCEGMEFASELVVKAAFANLRTTEVPISYHPRIGESKLKSLRDGWRHLRFLFQLSPRYLFIAPGAVITGLGFFGQLFMFAAPGGPYVLVSKFALALVALAGSQLLAMGTFARAHVKYEGPHNRGSAFRWLERAIAKRGQVIGGVLAVMGVVLAAVPFVAGSDALMADGGVPSSIVILGLLLVVLGCKLCLDAFFLGLLRRPGEDTERTYTAAMAARKPTTYTTATSARDRS